MPFFLGRLKTLENCKQNNEYLKKMKIVKFENLFFISFRTFCNNLDRKMETALFENENENISKCKFTYQIYSNKL